MGDTELVLPAQKIISFGGYRIYLPQKTIRTPVIPAGKQQESLI
jgi:hypothetical protein